MTTGAGPCDGCTCGQNGYKPQLVSIINTRSYQYVCLCIGLYLQLCIDIVSSQQHSSNITASHGKSGAKAVHIYTNTHNESRAKLQRSHIEPRAEPWRSHSKMHQIRARLMSHLWGCFLVMHKTTTNASNWVEPAQNTTLSSQLQYEVPLASQAAVLG